MTEPKEQILNEALGVANRKRDDAIARAKAACDEESAAAVRVYEGEEKRSPDRSAYFERVEALNDALRKLEKERDATVNEAIAAGHAPNYHAFRAEFVLWSRQKAGPVTTPDDKAAEIRKAYEDGEIKRLGHGHVVAYSAPSRFFLLGITPAMVSEVLQNTGRRTIQNCTESDWLICQATPCEFHGDCDREGTLAIEGQRAQDNEAKGGT